MNTSHHQQKVEEARTSLLKSQKQKAKKEQDLQELEVELAELERAWRVCEREIEECVAQRGKDVQLEEAQVCTQWDEGMGLKKKRGEHCFQLIYFIHL